MLGAATVRGIPLELTGSLLILTYLFWLKDVRYPPLRFPLGVIGVGLMLIVQAGFPFTWTWQEDGCQANEQAIQSAIQKYGREHDRRAPHNLEELVPRYLDKVPLCAPDLPEAEYVLESNGGVYTVVCTSGLHSRRMMAAGQVGQPLAPSEPVATPTPTEKPSYELVDVARSYQGGRIVLEGKLRLFPPGQYVLDARSEACVKPHFDSRPGSVFWDNEPDPDSHLYTFQASWPECHNPHLELRLKESGVPVAAFMIENKTTRPRHKPAFRGPQHPQSWYPEPPRP